LVVSAGAESVHAAQSTGGGTRGTPWTGAKGVTETVGRIMARSKSAQAAPMALPIRLAPQRRLAGASSSSLEPKPATQPQAPSVAVSSSFLGASLADSGDVPPDAMGAAGPSQFLVVVNGRVRTFNKNSGVPDGDLDTTTNSFFGSL